MDHQLGQTLISRGVITRAQLQEALGVQEQQPQLRVGEILFSLGHLNFGQLDAILEEIHQDIRIGQLLLVREFITREELDQALLRQEQSGEKLGEILIQLGSCTQSQIVRILEEQRRFREGYDELWRMLRRIN
ncbi:bacteriophage N4 adsorption protein B [compost metagenome]